MTASRNQRSFLVTTFHNWSIYRGRRTREQTQQSDWDLLPSRKLTYLSLTMVIVAPLLIIFRTLIDTAVMIDE
jgi:hypothetical protein